MATPERQNMCCLVAHFFTQVWCRCSLLFFLVGHVEWAHLNAGVLFFSGRVLSMAACERRNVFVIALSFSMGTSERCNVFSGRAFFLANVPQLVA